MSSIQDLFESIQNQPMKKKEEINHYSARYVFENGYGASVVCNPMSYGFPNLFEVAVLKGENICYDTPVTSDVVGWCDFAQVAKVLEEIKNLPKVEETKVEENNEC